MRPHRDDIKLVKDSIVIEPNNIIYYGIKSPRDLRVGENCIIHGNIICKKDLYLGRNVRVDGDVLAWGKIVVSSNTKIDGHVIANGDVVVLDGVEIKGDLLADGDLTLGNVTAKIIEACGDIRISGKVEVKRLNAGGRIVSIR